MTTLMLATWIALAIYAMRYGPATLWRVLRSPQVPRRYKIALALCALPIPGPVDELVAAALLARLARRARRLAG